jgi:hypothetical protein
MTNGSRRTILVLTALTLLSLRTGNLFGQAISGDVTGGVLDASGAGVPGASVDALNEDTGVKASASTGADGSYRLSNLPVGTYTLTASAKGFSTATVKNLKVALSNVITQNLTLQVGTAGRYCGHHRGDKRGAARNRHDYGPVAEHF